MPPNRNRLVLLGTGTCQLQLHRMASAVLAELEGLRLVFDFGRGIAHRLVELGLRQNDVEHIVLSHFHPDHFSDLIPFLHAAAWSQTDPRQRDLHIYGPPGLVRLLDGLLDLIGRDALGRPSWALRLHETEAHGLTIAGREFGYPSLPPAGNRGLKLRHRGLEIALTGDSSFHEQEVEFLRGVDLAVIDSGHLRDEEILELAARTQVRRLVCSHLYRELDSEDLNDRARRKGYSGEILIGEDLMEIPL